MNNLNVETAEEALCLIPTLREKFENGNEEQLEQLLEAMKEFQNT